MQKKTIDITKVEMLEELQSANERIAKLESVIFSKQSRENRVIGVYRPDIAWKQKNMILEASCQATNLLN